MSELTLPKTKLSFGNGTLTKAGSGNSVVGSFSVGEISSVRIEETREYGGAGFLGVTFLALAIVSKSYIPNDFWAWSAAIVCLAIVVFSVTLIKCHNIVIETSNGSVAYPVMDSFEEADGFVISLKYALEKSSYQNCAENED